MIATENLRGKSGVYCAIHRDSLKCYVGSSWNMHERRLGHLEKVNGSKCTTPFHKALRDLGPETFDFEVLEFCKRDQLAERENFWIKFYECAGLKGFNTNPSATYFRIGSLPEATKARMREAHKNRAPITEETRRKRSESCKGRIPGMLGKHHSQSTKDKIALAHAGKIRGPHTEEHKRKIGLSGRGRVLSDETKAKLSAARKAFAEAHGPMSQEQREKIRAALLGRKPPQKAIEASRARKGYKQSPETKDRVRKAITKWWADRKSKGIL